MKNVLNISGLYFLNGGLTGSGLKWKDFRLRVVLTGYPGTTINALCL